MEKNIYQRMLEATDKIQTVAKNLSVSTGKSSYKAVSEADILDAVKPIEVECGIYSYPLHREIVENMVIETEGQGYVKKQFFMRVQTTYRFVNIDNPSEYIEITSYGDGIDSGDKATGKAMTYCDKYALMKAYKISTGDDPDQKASEQLNQAKSYKPSRTQEDEFKKIDLMKEIQSYNNADYKKTIKAVMAKAQVSRVGELSLEDLQNLAEAGRAMNGKTTQA